MPRPGSSPITGKCSRGGQVVRYDSHGPPRGELGHRLLAGSDDEIAADQQVQLAGCNASRVKPAWLQCDSHMGSHGAVLCASPVMSRFELK